MALEALSQLFHRVSHLDVRFRHSYALALTPCRSKELVQWLVAQSIVATPAEAVELGQVRACHLPALLVVSAWQLLMVAVCAVVDGAWVHSPRGRRARVQGPAPILPVRAGKAASFRVTTSRMAPNAAPLLLLQASRMAPNAAPLLLLQASRSALLIVL